MGAKPHLEIGIQLIVSGALIPRVSRNEVSNID